MPETALEKLVVEIEKAGEEWVAAKLRSDQLEEGRKSVLAGFMNEGEGGEGKREREALACRLYKDYLRGMVEARAEMLRKKIRYDNLIRYFEVQRSQYVTERDSARTLGAKI